MGDTELAWDHSAGENLVCVNGDESLLEEDGAAFEELLTDEEGCRDEEEPVKLTGKQLRYVLRGLENAVHMLHNQGTHARRSARLQRAPDNGLRNNVQQANMSPGCRRRCVERWLLVMAFLQRHVFVLTFVLQALMVISASIMDVINWHLSSGNQQLTNPTIAVMVAFAILSLILNACVTGRIMRQIMSCSVEYKSLVMSFLCLTVSFAGVYTTVYQAKADSWFMLVPFASGTSQPLIVESYCRMLYLAVAVSCLSGTAAILPQQWYSYLLMTAQTMLSALYCAMAVYRMCAEGRSEEQHPASSPSRIAERQRLLRPNGSDASSQMSLLSRDHSAMDYGTMQNS